MLFGEAGAHLRLLQLIDLGVSMPLFLLQPGFYQRQLVYPPLFCRPLCGNCAPEFLVKILLDSACHRHVIYPQSGGTFASAATWRPDTASGRLALARPP